MPREVNSLASRSKLGLIGMYNRAQLLHGEIRITSHLQKGTSISFKVRLACENTHEKVCLKIGFQRRPSNVFLNRASRIISVKTRTRPVSTTGAVRLDYPE